MDACVKPRTVGWQEWLRRLAQRDGQGRAPAARGARVAEPGRHLWRAHLAGVAAHRG